MTDTLAKAGIALPQGSTCPDGIAFEGREALESKIAELTAAVEARDTFIAVAAHELRNPMTPILGRVELLLMQVRNGRCSLEQIEPRLAQIEQTLHYFVKRATVLLDISRINSGKLQLNPGSVDGTLALRHIAENFGAVAQSAGITLSVDLPDTLPMTCDRLALEQIVDNLVGNALKYGEGTPVRLTAEIIDTRIRICVSDRGPGVPQKSRARVFDRFERIVNDGEQTGGFGVGLWVVKQLVEAMDGVIDIRDVPGGGALFEVLLPQHAEGQSI